MIWLGYKDTKDESEWISASKLAHATDLVSDFHIIYPAKPSLLSLSWSHYYACLLHLYTFWGFFSNFQTLFSFHLLIFLLTHVATIRNLK